MSYKLVTIVKDINNKNQILKIKKIIMNQKLNYYSI